MDDYEQRFDNDNGITDLHEGDHSHRIKGNAALRKRYGRTVDDAATERETDANLLADVFDSATMPETEESDSLPRLVDDKRRKEMDGAKLAAAWSSFDKSQLDAMYATPPELPVAANDNARTKFKHTEPWHLEENIRRDGRLEYLATACVVRDGYDIAYGDPMAGAIHRPGKESTPDFGVQRTASGEVAYEHDRTLDRKKRIYDGKVLKSGKRRPTTSRDGERDAIRHDGFARRVKKPIVDAPFNAVHDDFLPERRIDAQKDLDAIRAAVGPLWQPLIDACCHNLTFKQIAETRGRKLPGEGSILVWEALIAAHQAIKARRATDGYRDFVSTGRTTSLAA
ncbi:hypothetical protein [Tardiphaga sp. 839_C3_N1_4]|uniref:hypothetical protein n=1 Tax=Tardiphaga sp. 839_C3_N1_4 TaxID=3240761 RepID=UPI003F27C59E